MATGRTSYSRHSMATGLSMSPFSLPRGLGFRRLRLLLAQPLSRAGFFCRRSACAGFAGLGLSRRSPLLPGLGSRLSLGGTVAGSRALLRRLSCLSLIGTCGGRSVWSLRALFTIEGGRSCEVHLEWKDDAELAAWTEYVQPQGEPRTTYDALGWAAAVESYRPVLSYNELGGMLEEKPSAFFDALSRILGLDALTDAARRLQQARSGREGLTRRGDTPVKPFENVTLA